MSRRLPVLALLGALALAVPAHASRNLYVSTLAPTNLVDIFDVSASGGLTAHSPASVGGGSNLLFEALTPDGAHLYVAAAGGSSLSAYDVSATGGLTPAATPTVATAGNPGMPIVSPDGAHLYVTGYGANAVSLFDVAADGTLTSRGSIATGAGPETAALTPDGRHLYVMNSGDTTISVFDIAPSGAVTAHTPATVTVPFDSFAMSITPDGRHAYVTNRASNTLSLYDIGADGGLTPQATPTVVETGGPEVGAITPDGRHLYVSNSTGGTISAWDIGPGGALTAQSPATVPAHGQGLQPVVSPDGRHLYVARHDDNLVSIFDLSAAGVPTPASPATVATSAGPAGGAISPDQGPAAAFTAAPGTNDAASFDASGSADPDGSVAHYDWDFGDGSTLADGGAAPSHVYASDGTYTVRLTVTDNEGCSTSTIFTGTNLLCNGGARAQATRSVTVSGSSTTTTTTTTSTTTTTTAASPTPTTTTPAVAPKPDPRIANLSVRRRCVRGATLVAPFTGRSGLSVTFSLSEDAKVHYAILRRVGSPRWRFCPPTGGTAPVTFAPVAARTGSGRAGANTTVLAHTAAARRGRHLAPGTYILRATAVTPDGRTSNAATVKFWVIG